MGSRAMCQLFWWRRYNLNQCLSARSFSSLAWISSYLARCFRSLDLSPDQTSRCYKRLEENIPRWSHGAQEVSSAGHTTSAQCTVFLYPTSNLIQLWRFLICLAREDLPNLIFNRWPIFATKVWHPWYNPSSEWEKKLRIRKRGLTANASLDRHILLDFVVFYLRRRTQGKLTTRTENWIRSIAPWA